MNTGPGEALIIGTKRALKNWRLLLLFYVANLVFAATLSLPIATVFAGDISRSLVGKDLLRGFSYTWYVEFVHANGTLFSSLLPQIVFILVLYILFEVFFAGGFYTAFCGSEKVKSKEFFAKGASYLFPILVVTLVEIFVLALLFGVNVIWATANENASRYVLVDYVVLRADLWRYGAVGLLFVIINALSDFVRAAVVIDDDDLWSKIKRGFIFAVRHPFSTLAVYFGGTVISASVIAMYFYYRFNIHAVTEYLVLSEIAVSQIFVLLRILSKLIFYASESVFYKENQIEVIKVKPEMLE